jgi:uncharacterized protein (TIRG00374 family)
MRRRSPPLEVCVDERNLVSEASPRVRAAVVVAGAISLLVLAPVIGDVYSSLGAAVHANVLWVVVAVGCTVAGFSCSWALQRLTLRVERWSDVAGPHLAGNAASNLLPLGSAFGSIIQLRMLMRNKVDLTRAVTALTITAMLSTVAGLFVFPVLILLPIDDSMDAWVDGVIHFGVVALVLCAPLVVLLLRSDRPMRWVASTVHNTLRRIPRCRPPADLAVRIVAERDAVREVLNKHKVLTVVTSIGRALGDYLALYASLLAVGWQPSPTVVLVAFVAANAAGMIPVTPGGLGFVEAGLSGTLVLLGAHEDRALAAVAIYRLVSCWLPVLAGVAAYVWSRRANPAPTPSRADAIFMNAEANGVPVLDPGPAIAR